MRATSSKNSSDTEFKVKKQSRWIPSFLATTIIVAGALTIPSTIGLAQPIIKPDEGNARLDQRLPSPLNQQSVSARLRAAARTFGVEIQSEHTAYASGNGISVVAAPIAGLENIHPSELTKGATTMFAYVEGPGDKAVPEAGYYLVETKASPTAIEEASRADAEGDAPATMTFINAQNENEVEVDAALQEVFSLEKNPEADRSRNFIDVSKQGSAAVPDKDISITIWVESDSWRACVDIRW